MYDLALPKKYIWGTVLWMSLFMLLIYVAKHYGGSFPEGSPERVALALAPLLVVVFGVRLDMSLFRKMDEMQRLIMLESLVFACYATLMVCAAGWLLEEFGGLPRMSPSWVIGASGLASYAGWLYLRRKYQ